MTRAMRALAFASACFVASCSLETCFPDPDPSPPTECFPLARATDAAAPSTCSGASEHEPNDRISQANRVAGATCSWQRLEGSADDWDVFRTTGKKCGGPLAASLATAGDGVLELCMFASCRYGRTAIDACDERPPDAGAWHAPGGMVGCCRTGPGELHVPARCDSEAQVVVTSAPEIDAFIVVKRASGAGCAPYTVDYRF